MSLLHDVLKPTLPSAVDQISARLSRLTGPDDLTRRRNLQKDDSSDDELINVISRSASPTRTGATTRRPPRMLHLSSLDSPKRSKTDPLRVLPTDLTQRIFAQLSVKDLAGTSRVSVKWNKSQSLNYLWFQHYRKVELNDNTLPTGKWTRRESKENWRKIYMKTARERASLDGSISRYGYATPPAMSSGYSTPREIREERWAQENSTALGGSGGLGKVEMREMYKELGGRKAKTKNKIGGGRDKGGWEGLDD
ncbi:hypothetical protein BS47DRAFT_1418298 [Hydnum rufescens UP504]|uniref:F-box domain-containing protein n=1 Tax=Hydnum rufescens UP504 TaxID=1448309 RepID=A0A9P6ANG7_9AGAM|nr:hypothetical protein BS47DRAFT_1418298 [Hydnum rufescens UP504]